MMFSRAKRRGTNGYISIAASIALAVVLAASYGGTKAEATTCTKSGTLTSSQTWTSSCVYVVNGVIVPSGKTLTINSGTIVKVNGSPGIRVSSGGTLNASGTTLSPITFTSYRNDSAGGDTNGDGSSTTPAAGDYMSAIVPDGGTVSVSHASFSYGASDIGEDSSGVNTGSHLTVTDSSFTHSDVGIAQVDDASISLQSNSFTLATSGSGNYAISANESDLSGITLYGTDKNTFSGSGANVAVAVQGSVPTGSTWSVGSGQVLLLQASGGVAVDVSGTVYLHPGTIVKVNGSPEGFKVESGGVLNAIGTSGSLGTSTGPIVFTSMFDDSVGGDTNSDGTSSGASGDYPTAVRFEAPGSSDVISYVVFKYASSALSIGATGTLSVDNTQFTNNAAAFDADTTSTENSALGSLAPTCLWPYANSIHITYSWFGAASGYGYPGNSVNVSGYLGQTMPSGYPGLSSAYSDFTTLAPFTVNGGDNTIPWTVFTCAIPGVATVSFPVTPVYLPNFTNSSAITLTALWTDSNLSE